MSNENSVNIPSNRIYSIDYLRIVAFCGVVFLHTVTPDGELSTFLNILSRFSVIFFFIIAGFFFNEQHALRPKIVSLAKIGCISGVFYCVLGVLGVTSWFDSLLATGNIGLAIIKQIVSFLVWNSFEPAYPLWFVFALLYVYLLYSALVRIGIPKKSIATFCLGLFTARVVLCEMLGTVDALDTVLRSWLFFGLPCFSIGVLLKEFNTRMASITSTKLLILSSIGIACSVVECYLFGLQECYVGQVVSTSAIFLFCLKHPFSSSKTSGVLRRVIGSRFCLFAYLIHYAVICIYDRLVDCLQLPSAGFYEGVRFLLVVIVSMSIALLLTQAIDRLRSYSRNLCT